MFSQGLSRVRFNCTKSTTNQGTYAKYKRDVDFINNYEQIADDETG